MKYYIIGIQKTIGHLHILTQKKSTQETLSRLNFITINYNSYFLDSLLKKIFFFYFTQKK